MEFTKIYEKSRHSLEGATVYLAEKDGRDVLVCEGRPYFGGEAGVNVFEINHDVMNKMRQLFPFTAPVPVLNKDRSVGVGDRLGIAAPGHIRVFEKYDAMPVFAQQSIRELNLTNRTYEDVLDAASLYVFRENFTYGFGADGDHLKKPEDIEYALSLGFTMITLDLSDHIHADASGAYSQNVDEIYLGKSFDVEGNEIAFTKEELDRVKGIYGDALDFAVKMYDQFLKDGKYQAEFEISIDETGTPTKPAEHYFVASELQRRGVKFMTIAPRFIGEFQKGIDYIGDVNEFDAEMKVHAAIARAFGHKVSVHSGSDKFSVFPSVGRNTNQKYHVKTAGTNWLEAMRIVAKCDPRLYREIHAYALIAFEEATKYYHVTTDLNKVPALDTLSDLELPALFENDDARQLIHITYGLILSLKDENGNSVFRDRLYAFWRAHEEEYAEALYKHIGRHLKELGCPER
ncbi:MAG: tagaturonate epimerase family protein [Clostridia bacterium]|nr:tagaturonate epimerase family protein [Clostridia bacterium]